MHVGNAARKARKRDGIPHEKPAKAPTAAYQTKKQAQEVRRRQRRAEEQAAAMIPAMIAASRELWTGGKRFRGQG